MSIKKIQVHHLVLVVILLCLFYFGLQYMRDIKMEEGFSNELPENTNDRNYYSTNQSNSSYYPLQVDSNDLEELQSVNNLLKKMNISSMQDLFNSITNLTYLDKWTGYWRNFNDTITETSSGIFTQNLSGIDTTNDNILVLRKIQDNIFFSLTRREYLENNYNNINNLPYSRYMFVGMAKIDSSDKNKANIVKIYQDTYNQSDNNVSLEGRSGYITFIPSSLSEPNDKISFTFNLNTIANFTKRKANIKGVSNFSDTIPYYYETTSTVFSDLQCPPTKEKCTFQTNASNPIYTGCVAKGNKNPDGTCKITSSTQNSDVCYLNNETGPISYPITGGTSISFSKCNPNYYPLQNNSDYMINRFLKGNSQCPSYLSELTSSSSNSTYLIYYLYDTNKIFDLGYQVWGFSSSDSKLTTQSTILSKLLYQYQTSNSDFKTFVMNQLNMNLFNSISDFKTINKIDDNTAKNMVTWEVKKLYTNTPSCYFKINSKATSQKSNYNIMYDNMKGTVGVSVLSGGKNNSLILSDEAIYSNNNVKAYMGYLKNSSFYISPGNSVDQELNPFMGVNTNVCKLVSRMNVQGKWLIMKITPPSNKTFLDVLMGTV